MPIKKILSISLPVLLLCGAWLFRLSASAANSVPGSEGDPVVTKSYVDQQIAQALETGATSKIPEDISEQIENLVKSQINSQSGNAFTPVSVSIGQTIYGSEGCEMILRSGQGIIVTSTDAVVNATAGVDLKNGADVPQNSLLIISRDDGRGVKATDNCWLLVKGAYTIK